MEKMLCVIIINVLEKFVTRFHINLIIMVWLLRARGSDN